MMIDDDDDAVDDDDDDDVDDADADVVLYPFWLKPLWPQQPCSDAETHPAELRLSWLLLDIVTPCFFEAMARLWRVGTMHTDNATSQF